MGLEAGLAVELMVGLLVGGMLARLPPGMVAGNISSQDA